MELGFEILKAKKVLALQKGFVLIGILLILFSQTKRFQDSRDDAVQLEHQVVALLPAASSVFQLLLLVVAVRVEQTGPENMCFQCSLNPSPAELPSNVTEVLDVGAGYARQLLLPPTLSLNQRQRVETAPRSPRGLLLLLGAARPRARVDRLDT